MKFSTHLLGWLFIFWFWFETLALASSSTEHYSFSQKESTIKIGTEVYYFDYKEELENVGLKSEERGIVPGIHVGYSYLSDQHPFFFDLGASYSSIGVFYDGSLQNGTPHTGTSGLNIARIDFRMGALLLRGHSNEMGLHLGIFNRRWNRVLGMDEAFNLFEENYTSFFLPVGLIWNHTFSQSFQASLDASVNFPIKSQFEVVYPPSFFGTIQSVRLNNSLMTKTGWKIQTPITYRLSQSLSATASPFFESIEFVDSYVGVVIGNRKSVQVSEPSSRTYQYGTQLRIGLHL